MKEPSIHDFEVAIKSQYDCLSALNSRELVCEALPGKPCWEGEVLTFDLLNHPTAARCYAWAVEGRITTVLHDGAVDSPRAAVRSQIGSVDGGD
ncbi:MAG: hypothetical protein GTN89_13560 [Acidobacteria bacterium]|nr:hypothetical protein [Acidobacteriota bacterium]NIM60378.1 hypothetical protein [Acidobacteriota bacterium]NIO60313.1 hypothetical protein [Acidobacteriota bacterium]NIQ31368.1 hypothetical protein [Acidobacteriota bacterium]NIQ86591.1 hypothetical protein [Acidobacteriota bacterium]